MEKPPVTIIEMDDRVRKAILQAREQLKNDKKSLEILEDLCRIWNRLCYQLIMSYTGLTLMQLVTEENAAEILHMAHKMVGNSPRIPWPAVSETFRPFAN